MIHHYVTRTVNKKADLAQTAENRYLNRYRDIIPFDDNVIKLKSDLFVDVPKDATPEGKVNSTYVNASPIVFPDCKQKFIATQAPRTSTLNHFWHMIIQEEVALASSTSLPRCR